MSSDWRPIQEKFPHKSVAMRVRSPRSTYYGMTLKELHKAKVTTEAWTETTLSEGFTNSPGSSSIDVAHIRGTEIRISVGQWLVLTSKGMGVFEDSQFRAAYMFKDDN